MTSPDSSSTSPPRRSKCSAGRDGRPASRESALFVHARPKVTNDPARRHGNRPPCRLQVVVAAMPIIDAHVWGVHSPRQYTDVSLLQQPSRWPMVPEGRGGGRTSRRSPARWAARRRPGPFARSLAMRPAGTWSRSRWTLSGPPCPHGMGTLGPRHLQLLDTPGPPPRHPAHRRAVGHQAPAGRAVGRRRGRGGRRTAASAGQRRSG